MFCGAKVDVFSVMCKHFLKKVVPLPQKHDKIDMKSDKFQIVRLPEYADARGCLNVVEDDGSLPFVPSRVFWITGVPKGARRGGHAHWTCSEIVFAAAGSFVIELDDGEARSTFVLDNPGLGVLVPAGAWCELYDFAENTVCMVLASEKYDASGYVHEKEEWRRLKNED